MSSTQIPENTTAIGDFTSTITDTTKEYTLSKIKQLIDINGEVTNFRCRFDIKSQNDIPFLAVIVNQSTLDNAETLDFQPANGGLSGEIVADKNVYQSYFLVLKASDEYPSSIVQVSMQFEKLDKFIPQTKSKTKSKTDDKTGQKGSEWVIDTPTVQICVGVGVTIGIVYYMVQNNIIDLNAIFPKQAGNNSKSGGSSIHKSLLDKLKQLPME